MLTISRAEIAIRLTAQAHQWVTKMVRRPECMMYEKILENWVWPSLGRKGVRGHTTEAY